MNYLNPKITLYYAFYFPERSMAKERSSILLPMEITHSLYKANVEPIFPRRTHLHSLLFLYGIVKLSNK